MAKKEKTDGDTVKKSTMYTVAFITLVIGFFGGLVFGVYKSTKGALPQIPVQSQQALQEKESDADLENRIGALELKTTLNPESAEAWTDLGNVYFDNSRFEEAIAAYKKSLAINPDNANVMTDMGVMYRRSGQPLEAIKAFDDAVKIDPRHEVSRFNKGIVLMHDLNDPEAAVRAWEDLVRVNPMATAPGGQPVKELAEKLKAGIPQEK